ncbi:hypothetical protein IJ114_03085 [Candidatus Saccharibacteria bacterium]|nr:hypothetical protein [Candidatus Saccharibacteria bacterium]
MPGVLHHYFFATEVFRQTEQVLQQKTAPEGPIFSSKALNREDFFLGNVLPDLAKDKELTHFKDDSWIAVGFRVPNLREAKKELALASNQSLAYGAFAHLFLDQKFIEFFVWPRFEFRWDEDRITCKRTGKVYSVSEFFSPNGLYFGYSELNGAILDKGLIDCKYVHSLPDWPKQLGIERFDTWREESWREELNRYLLDLVETSGTVFLAAEFVQFIRSTATDFISVRM